MKLLRSNLLCTIYSFHDKNMQVFKKTARFENSENVGSGYRNMFSLPLYSRMFSPEPPPPPPHANLSGGEAKLLRAERRKQGGRKLAVFLIYIFLLQQVVEEKSIGSGLQGGNICRTFYLALQKNN